MPPLSGIPLPTASKASLLSVSASNFTFSHGEIALANRGRGIRDTLPAPAGRLRAEARFLLYLLHFCAFWVLSHLDFENPFRYFYTFIQLLVPGCVCPYAR